MKSFFLSILILPTLLLAGCGFHLRNQNQLPPTLHALHIETHQPYSAFTTALHHKLHALHISTNTHTASVPTLIIHNVRFSHGVPTLGPSNEARVYPLRYHVIFSLRDRQNHTLFSHQTVGASGRIVLNPNQTLNTNNELTLLERELMQATIHKLMNRLRAVRP